MGVKSQGFMGGDEDINSRVYGGGGGNEGGG